MLLPPGLGFSPHPPVSVYGTGSRKTIAAFLGSRLTCFATISSLPITVSLTEGDLPPSRMSRLDRVFRSRLMLSFCVPTSSVYVRYRNLNLFPIGYAFRPRLRPRLTQGGSALPWKPWIFARKDSHLPLATHSGILSSYPSTAPCGTASSVLRMLLYHSYVRMNPRLRCRVSAPDIFGAGPLDQ